MTRPIRPAELSSLYWPWLLLTVVGIAPAAAQSSGPTPGPQAPSEQSVAGATSPSQAAPSTPESWAIHGQTTFIDEYHPAFRSPYIGPLSQNAGSRGNETFDATIYGGVRLWPGAQAWVNPEIDQGFGLGKSVGIAGFPNGDAFKLGAADPYVRVQRLFLRQTINLGGEAQAVSPDVNVLGGSLTNNRIVLTVGKIAAADIFDNNKYAHDPRNDFLNGSIIDAGSYDYPADNWGYTYAATAEWYQDWWAIRGGILDLSTTPSSPYLDSHLFSQMQYDTELEERHDLWGQPGKLKLLGFLTRGNLGIYGQAVAAARATGTVPNITSMLAYRSRGGVSVNLEQQVRDGLGVFLRAGIADPSTEVDSYSDISKTVSGGLSLTGARWQRPDDAVGLGFARNEISRQYKSYLNAGGLGILIGDGKLPNSGAETIVETFYSAAVLSYAHVTADYQFIATPAYNRDRGPISVLSLRLHAQF